MYLGCIHQQRFIVLNNRSINVLIYNVDDFLRSSVKLHTESHPDAPTLRRVSTPCCPEDHHDVDAARVGNVGGDLTANQSLVGGVLAANSSEQDADPIALGADNGDGGV